MPSSGLETALPMVPAGRESGIPVDRFALTRPQGACYDPGRRPLMNLMRCTVIDATGAVSFIVDGEAMPALAASCSRNPLTLDQLLEHVEPLYADLRERVLNGLALFDEHNLPGNYTSIHMALEVCAPHQQPVFRVVDDRTREASL